MISSLGKKPLIILLTTLLILSGFGVIFGDINQNQEKLKLNTDKKGNDPWPMENGDVRNSRRSLYNTEYINKSSTWKHEPSMAISSNILVGERGPIYISSGKEGKRIVMVNSTDGSIFNVIQTGYQNLSLLALNEDKIFVSSDNNIHSFNRDGSEEWNLEMSSRIWEDEVVIAEDRLYVRTINTEFKPGQLHCINTDGELKWSFTNGNIPVLNENGTIYTARGKTLYALNKNGTEKWNVVIDENIERTAGLSLTPGNSIIVNSVGKSSSMIYSIKEKEVKWSKIFKYSYINDLAIGKDGDIYLTPRSANPVKLYCLTKEGKTKWIFNPDETTPPYLPKTSLAMKPIVGGNGRVYFTGYKTSSVNPGKYTQGTLYAIDIGQKVWNYTVQSPNLPASPIFGEFGSIYVFLGGKLNYFGYESNPLPSKVIDLEILVGNGKVELSWSKPDYEGLGSVEKYNIYRSKKNESLSIITNVSETKFVDDTVKNGETYYYTITAVNNVGEGPKGDLEEAFPKGTPTKPINLKADVGDDYVELDWNKPNQNGGSAITEYNVYKGKISDQMSLMIKVEESEFNDTDVNKGETYYYTVSAVNEIGESSKAEVINLTLLELPSKPMDVKIESGNGYVKLQWQEPEDTGGSDINEYKIYRGKTSDDISLIETVVDKEYNDTDVNNGEKYHYQISAINNLGEGNRTDIVTGNPEKTGENDFIPGFSLQILLLIITITVILYGPNESNINQRGEG